MPSDFPTTFPIYLGARLTEASLTANFPLNGKSTWGMVWETLDDASAVWEYYMSRLNHGEWTVVLTGRPHGDYSAIFNSRSGSNAGGMLGVLVVGPVTKISLALTLP